MRNLVIRRNTIIVLVLAFFALAVSACGGQGRPLSASNAYPRVIALDDALAQLDAMAVPAGVKPEVFQQLEDALAAALRAKGASKIICTPPTGPDNQVNDLRIVDNGDTTHSLVWHYRNVGDYNQDGVVGIADITPLAMHYNETWATGEENTLVAVIDGSNNNVIDIADVTPIAMYFGNQVVQYTVEGSNISDSGFVYVVAYPPPVADGISRGTLSSNLGAAPAYTYWRVFPVDEGSVQGDYSNVAEVGDFIWHLRTLDTLGAGSGYTSLVVVNGNPAVAYEDFNNGDLRFVRATVASGTTWGTPITLDSAAYTGEYCSMAIVNGNPAVSYYEADNGNLRYVRASDADGTNWAEPITITSDGNIGQYTSLVVTNGKPAISYYDVNGLRLMYVRANDADGTAWGMPVLVDDVGSVGQYSSMEVVNGRPAIAYYDATNANRDLKYVRASDADGTAWGPRVVVNTLGDTGSHASLEVVNGNPAVSYYEVGSMTLQYVRATDANGDGWSDAVTVDDWAKAGRYNSLAVINGRPAISYNEDVIFSLRYARALDANGNVWGEPVMANNMKFAYFTSLAEVNGNPAICYIGGGLQYAYYF